ncbi:MAG: SGNH/GDSL hydrolase family protein, partial [Bdellovibrionales bacterium]|nr:SGNH/GDSL hydrolase family protein [Bdellovibrionales bacterium]
MRSLLSGGLIAVLSLFVSLVILEYCLPHFDVNSGLPPNGQVAGKRYTWGHEVRKNSFGARGPEPAIPKPPNVYRVLIIGDSLTWGAGVSEEERYSNVAEHLLKDLDFSKHIEIVNIAQQGNPLIAYRDQLLKLGEQLEPNLVVIGFCLNDPQPAPQDYSSERASYIKRQKALLLKAISIQRYFPHIGQLLRRTIIQWGEWRGVYPAWPDALERVYDPKSSEWQRFEVALKEIVTWSTLHGLPQPIFAVLNQGSSTVNPTWYSKPDPLLLRFQRWWAQALAAAQSSGF